MCVTNRGAGFSLMPHSFLVGQPFQAAAGFPAGFPVCKIEADCGEKRAFAETTHAEQKLGGRAEAPPHKKLCGIGL